MRNLCLFNLIFFLAGCATLIKTPKQEIEFSADSTAVEVYINDEFKGQTPFKTKLFRKKDYQLKLILPNRKTNFSDMEKKSNNLHFVNLVSGGLVGFGIDMFTGSHYSFVPKDILLSDEENGTEIYLHVRKVPRKWALNINAGYGSAKYTFNRNTKSIYPEMSVDFGFFPNDYYEIGVGVNFQGKRIHKYSGDDGPEETKFSFLPIYSFLKLGSNSKSPHGAYLIAQTGLNLFFYDEKANALGLIYGGFGAGLFINKKFILEGIYKYNTIIVGPFPIGIGYCESFSLTLGYMFSFSKKYSKVHKAVKAREKIELDKSTAKTNIIPPALIKIGLDFSVFKPNSIGKSIGIETGFYESQKFSAGICVNYQLSREIASKSDYHEDVVEDAYFNTMYFFARYLVSKPDDIVKKHFILCRFGFKNPISEPDFNEASHFGVGYSYNFSKNWRIDSIFDLYFPKDEYFNNYGCLTFSIGRMFFQ
jgi:hypothetical protein